MTAPQVSSVVWSYSRWPFAPPSMTGSFSTQGPLSSQGVRRCPPWGTPSPPPAQTNPSLPFSSNDRDLIESGVRSAAGRSRGWILSHTQASELELVMQVMTVMQDFSFECETAHGSGTARSRRPSALGKRLSRHEPGNAIGDLCSLNRLPLLGLHARSGA